MGLTGIIAQGEEPTQGSDGWVLVSHGVGETQFGVDRDGVVAPKLAEGIDRLSDRLWAARLRPEARLSDACGPCPAGRWAPIVTGTHELDACSRD